MDSAQGSAARGPSRLRVSRASGWEGEGRQHRNPEPRLHRDAGRKLPPLSSILEAPGVQVCPWQFCGATALSCPLNELCRWAGTGVFPAG